MKKLFFCLLLGVSSLVGDYDMVLEAKVGYFFFTDSKMNKVYNDGGLDLQITGTSTFCPSFNMCGCCSTLKLYGSAEYIQRSGCSLHGHQDTRIWLYPLSLGVQAVFPLFCDIDYFITLGPRYFFVTAHNNSSYVQKNMKSNGLGGFANAGVRYRKNCFDFDVFGEYSYVELPFHSSKHNSKGHRTQVGGLTFGLGLGYQF